MYGKRNTKIEILRIIAMLCIISGHALGHGKLLDACMQTGEAQAAIGQFLEALIMPAVNVLVIISGYFGISSKFTLKKAFTLWTQVLFYSIVLYFVMVFLGATEFSLNGTIKAAFPVCFRRYWFFSVYMIHENPDVSRWLWKTVNAVRFARSYMMPLALLAFSITVFIICVIIDKLTCTQVKKAVSKINTSKIDDKISEWVSPV